MGYYFTTHSEQEIIVPESAAVAAHLDRARLEHMISSAKYAWNLTIDDSAGDLIESALLSTGFDLERKRKETVCIDGEEQSAVVYVGYYDSKYNTIVDCVLHWLGSLGAGFNIECTGEDGKMWNYYSILGKQESRTRGMQSIPAEEKMQYEKAYSALQEVSKILASDTNDSLKIIKLNALINA